MPRRDSGACAPLLLAALFLVSLLTLPGCFSSVPRETATPPPATATPIPTPTITPTLPPTPTVTPTPPPTVTPPPTPTPTTPPPVPTPTPDESVRLFLDVLGPDDGSIVPNLVVVVFGVTLPEAAVTVNGIPATVDANGGFRQVAELQPGINDVEVITLVENGDTLSRTLRVTSLAQPPQPFFLVIREPEDQSVVYQPDLRLVGRTAPEAIVSVKGVSVDVDAFGDFSTVVRLDPGGNTIGIVATSADGQEESRVLAVIYRPPEQ